MLSAFFRGYLMVLDMQLDTRTNGLMSHHIDQTSTAGPGYKHFTLPGSTRSNMAVAPGVTQPVSYGYGGTWSVLSLTLTSPAIGRL